MAARKLAVPPNYLLPLLLELLPLCGFGAGVGFSAVGLGVGGGSVGLGVGGGGVSRGSGVVIMISVVCLF